MAEITIAAKTADAKHGKSFAAYVARPAAAKAPGLLLIQEIFGINQVMRDLADGYARQGYLVVCPDLFWRQQPGIQITDKEMPRAFELYQGFNPALGLEDLLVTLDAIRKLPECSGKVGTVGYCLGGNLAYQMACKSGIDAAVSYYGVGIEGSLDWAPGIKKPLLMHIAEMDGFVPAEAQAKIKAALAGNRNVTLHSYAGRDHAFARVGGSHYDKADADLANGRTAAFFKQHLG
jgi:carboxymethylenebutenolidase